MCRNVNEFETLVSQITKKKAKIEAEKKEVAMLEQEIKDYMTRRKKETLVAKEAQLKVVYRRVNSPKFNKNLFVQEKGEDEYKKYLVLGSCMRLNYCKIES